jgi:hypothetical protein
MVYVQWVVVSFEIIGETASRLTNEAAKNVKCGQRFFQQEVSAQVQIRPWGRFVLANDDRKQASRNIHCAACTSKSYRVGYSCKPENRGTTD